MIKQRSRVFLLLIHVLAAVCGSAYGWTKAYQNSVVLDAGTGFTFVWNYTDTTLSAGFTVNALGWAGMGISSTVPGSMSNADIVLGYVANGQVNLQDYFATSQTQPDLDGALVGGVRVGTQDITVVSGSKTATSLTFEYTRLLKTGDTQRDFDWNPCVPMSVIWAYNPSQVPANGKIIKHGISNRGTQMIQLCPQCTAPSQIATPTLGSTTSSSISISWAAPATLGGSAITYVIRIDDGAAGPYSVVYSGPALSYTITGLLSGTTYRITAEATNCVGSGGISSALSATTQNSVPATPSAPVLTGATPSTLSISWVAPPSGGSAITGYRVYFANATLNNWKLVYSGFSLSWTQTALKESDSYSFMISASNALGFSANSSVATFKTASASATAPNAPTQVTKTNATVDSLSISWNAPANDGGSPILDYSVFYAEQGVTDFALGYRGIASNAIISSLLPSTSYSVKVSARNSIGSSANTTAITVNTLAAPVAPAAPPVVVSPPMGEYTYTSSVKAVGGKLTLSWAIQGSTIAIKMVCQCTGWVGIGFAGSMVDADLIIGRVDTLTGVVTVNDYWSTAQQEPSLDTALGGTEDILSFNGTEVNGVTTIEFVRNLNPADTQHDAAIVSGTNKVIVAFHDNDDRMKYHGTNFDYLNIDFMSGNAAVGGTAGIVQSGRVAHGAIMFISWGVLLPFGVLWARYAKNLKKSPKATLPIWFSVHRALQPLAFLVAVVGIVIIFATSTAHFTSWHSILGIIVMILGILQILTALFRPDRPGPGEKRKPARLLWEIQHYLFGRGALVGAVVAIFAGIHEISDSIVLYALYGVFVGLGIVFIVVMEIRAWRKQRKNAVDEESKL